MKCPNCGHENRDVARFCQQCGTLLTPQMPEPEPEPAGTTEMPAGNEIPAEDEGSDWAEETIWAEDETVDAGPVAEEQEAALAEQPTAVPEEAGEATIWEVPEPRPEVEGAAEVSPEPADAIETEPPVEPEAPAYVADETEEQEEQAELEQPLDSAEDEEELISLDQEPDTAEPAPDEVPADALLWREEPAPLSPLELGTILSGRYRVIELDVAQAGENLYQVRDLQRCPQCGYDQNSPDEAFCASCGAVLDQKPVATMLERPATKADQPVDAAVEDHFSTAGRAYWVWREGVDTGPLEPEARPLQLVIGYQSDTGRTRELNEDSVFVAHTSSVYEAVDQVLALLIVADGMGGHEGGEVASKLAIRTAVELLMHTVFVPELSGRPLSPEQLIDWMRKASEAANDRVYMQRRERHTDMGTTFTSALVKGSDLYLAHVGDCRAFRWNESGLEQLTIDHSIVASMVASGTARPEEVYTHPQRSVIYRCIGDQPQVQVDTRTLQIAAGDRIILCSDGLWEMVRNEGIEDVMLRETDPQRACQVLVDEANAAGGLDNISVIVVQF